MFYAAILPFQNFSENKNGYQVSILSTSYIFWLLDWSDFEIWVNLRGKIWKKIRERVAPEFELDSGARLS